MNTTKRKPYAPVQFKAISIENSSYDENSRTVSGYLAVFGNIDSDRDILVKGCFARSLKNRGVDSESNRKIAFCWQHDIKNPIGRFIVLKEDDYGLYFEAILDDPESVPDAKRALAQLKSGTLNQFSIGFAYVWDKIEYNEELDAFIVKEVNLFEGSVVTMGANELTYFAGLKGEAFEQEWEKVQKETEQLIKDLPQDIQYKARQIITKNIALAQVSDKKDELKRNSQNTEALAGNHPEEVPLVEKSDPQTKPAFDIEKAIRETTFFNH